MTFCHVPNLEPGIFGAAQWGFPKELSPGRYDSSLGFAAVTGRHWMTCWRLLRSLLEMMGIDGYEG